MRREIGYQFGCLCFAAAFVAALVLSAMTCGCAAPKATIQQEHGEIQQENNALKVAVGERMKLIDSLNAELTALKLEKKQTADASNNGSGWAKTTNVMGMTGAVLLGVLVIFMVCAIFAMWMMYRLLMALIPLVNTESEPKRMTVSE